MKINDAWSRAPNPAVSISVTERTSHRAHRYTSLAGRVRNTSLPKSHALLPLLEAVVNGIQAIDARFGDDVGRGRLSVRIQRSPLEELDLGPVGPGRMPLKPVVGFSVEDNGVGFTPENMTSFETPATFTPTAFWFRSWPPACVLSSPKCSTLRQAESVN